MQFLLFFPFFNGTLVTDIETGSAQDTSALINFIRDTDIDAAFGAEKGAPAACNTPVGYEIELVFLFVAHNIPPTVKYCSMYFILP